MRLAPSEVHKSFEDTVMTLRHCAQLVTRMRRRWRNQLGVQFSVLISSQRRIEARLDGRFDDFFESVSPWFGPEFYKEKQ